MRAFLRRLVRPISDSRHTHTRANARITDDRNEYILRDRLNTIDHVTLFSVHSANDLFTLLTDNSNNATTATIHQSRHSRFLRQVLSFLFVWSSRPFTSYDNRMQSNMRERPHTRAHSLQQLHRSKYAIDRRQIFRFLIFASSWRVRGNDRFVRTAKSKENFVTIKSPLLVEYSHVISQSTAEVKITHGRVYAHSRQATISRESGGTQAIDCVTASPIRLSHVCPLLGVHEPFVACALRRFFILFGDCIEGLLPPYPPFPASDSKSNTETTSELNRNVLRFNSLVHLRARLSPVCRVTFLFVRFFPFNARRNRLHFQIECAPPFWNRPLLPSIVFARFELPHVTLLVTLTLDARARSRLFIFQFAIDDVHAHARTLNQMHTLTPWNRCWPATEERNWKERTCTERCTLHPTKTANAKKFCTNL